MNNSLYDQFLQTCNKYPNSLAERFESSTWSYSKLNKRIVACAKKLQALGVKKGEIVSVSLPNCPLAIDLFYAISAIGAISYNIHPLTPASSIEDLMRKASSEKLFCLCLYSKNIRSHLATDITLISINPYQGINPIKSFAIMKMSGKADNTLPFEKIRKAKSFKKITVNPEDDAIYLNTGGTNGDPKIVRLSNRAINHQAEQGYNLIGGKVQNIKMLTAIPLFHGFGLAMGVHTPLSHGASTVLMMKFNTKEAIKHIRKGRATVIIGVPALFNALLSKKEFYGPFLSKQIISFIGGDSVNQSLLDRFDQAMKDNGSSARLFEGYGLTETISCSNVNTFANNRKGSIGKPLPGIEEKIVDSETRKELPVNTPGEILISGKTLMNGYLRDETLTEEVLFKDEKGKLWLSTKDYGYIDADGFLYFKQRLKRIVKVNGETLCPKDLENQIMKLNEIFECYCYGVNHSKKGHCFRLAIVLKREYKNSNPNSIKEAVYNQIVNTLTPGYYPDRIDIYESFPHTNVGKIDSKFFDESNNDGKID
ncbi:MAG: class I adenylate-forming enzyme family protein [Bacilli bacterium]